MYIWEKPLRKAGIPFQETWLAVASTLRISAYETYLFLLSAGIKGVHCHIQRLFVDIILPLNDFIHLYFV